MKPLAVIVAALAVAAAPLAAKPAADWTKRVTANASGAYVMGNPAASVKLVEYLSYTCSHCAHYALASADVLKKDFVAPGRTSVEFRHAIRDPYDFAAALIARCGGASKFFATSQAILAAQPAWMDQAAQFDGANRATLNKLPVDERLKRLARGAGLDAIGREQGLSDAQINKCLTNKAEQKRVTDMANAAWGIDKIPGTPYFRINGSPVENVSNWASLEPKLRAAQN